MDAHPLGGAPQAALSAPGPQGKSVFFFRLLSFSSREEVEEQAVERMEVIADGGHRQQLSHGATDRTQHGASIGAGVARGAWRVAWWMLEGATDGGLIDYTILSQAATN